MRKNTYMIPIMLMIIFLISSCTNIAEGKINTTLDAVGNIGEFKTAEETDSFCTTPCVYIESEYSYLIRHFPAELPSSKAEFDEFINEGQLSKKIEVYRNFDYDTIVAEVELEDIQNRKIVFYNISKDTDHYYIIGKEANEDTYITKSYIFNLDGRLVNEQQLNIDEIDTAFIFNGKYYSLQHKSGGQSQCLMEYNLEGYVQNFL